MKNALLFFALLFCSCNCDNTVSGGTSTETTNGMLILESNNVPVVNATVIIVDNSVWYESAKQGISPAADTLVSDTNGRIYPIFTDMSGYTVQIQHNGEAAIVKGFTDTIVLQKGYSLVGSAIGFDSVKIAGTTLVSPVVNNSFLIENVPIGIYTLYAKSPAVFSYLGRFELSQFSTEKLYEVDLYTILFDDFQGGFQDNPLAAVTYGVSWYTYSDKESGALYDNEWTFFPIGGSGTSTVLPEESTGTIMATVDLRSGVDGAYGGLGAILEADSSKRGFDLTKMSALQIKIRGTGKVIIAFRTEQIDSLNEAGAYGFIAPWHFLVDLTGTMTDTILQVSNIDLNPGYDTIALNYPWLLCSKSVKNIQIGYRETENSTDSTYWFEVDERRFFGFDLKLPL